MQGNVKHGDYLRTLGGAMTAQCKVLHLLFSQSDYPKIVECHIIQSVSVYVCVCVIYCVCYHREALAAAIWNKENHCHVHPSVVSTSWSEEYRFLEWHRDKVLFWVISFFFLQVKWPLKVCLLYMVMLLDSMPSSSNMWWGITILNSSFSESQGTYAVLLTLSQFQ